MALMIKFTITLGVMSAMDEFKTKITDLLDFVLVQYFNEGKTYLRIGIGCTGQAQKCNICKRFAETY